MKRLLWIGLGSGIGGALRYLMDSFAVSVGLSGFPVSTFCINLLGSLLIGFLAGLWATADAQAPAPQKWAFWVTGFCGGFTTFSTFSWQIVEWVRQGEGTLAGAYAAGSVFFGLVAVGIGLMGAMRRRAG